VDALAAALANGEGTGLLVATVDAGTVDEGTVEAGTVDADAVDASGSVDADGEMFASSTTYAA
jgi:hypothetical protein